MSDRTVQEFRRLAGLERSGLPVGPQRRTMHEIRGQIAGGETADYTSNEKNTDYESGKEPPEELPYITFSPAEDMKWLEKIATAVKHAEIGLQDQMEALLAAEKILSTENDGQAGWIAWTPRQKSWKVPPGQGEATKAVLAWADEVDHLRALIQSIVKSYNAKELQKAFYEVRTRTDDLRKRCALLMQKQHMK